jgi:hypothetical protein
MKKILNTITKNLVLGLFVIMLQAHLALKKKAFQTSSIVPVVMSK